jgi:hypothetical protein
MDHEAGHALAAVALRLKVFAVEISRAGGLCRVERPRRIRHSVFVYISGLLAQAVAFSVTLAYVDAFGSPGNPFANAIVFTFTFVNAVLFVINLIPHRSSRSGLATEGSVLWRLFLLKISEAQLSGAPGGGAASCTRPPHGCRE